MRRFNSIRAIALFGVLALAQPAFAAPPEVLVTNAAAIEVTGQTLNPQNRRGAFIQNNGPNDIWCGLGKSTFAVLTKSMKVAASGGTWTVNSSLPVYCIAAVTDQLTGAGTDVTEVPK